MHILVVNGLKVRRPVFVLGAPQSGTELLARALKRTRGFHITVGRTNVLQVAWTFARRPSISEGRGEGAARVYRDAFAEAWQINAHGCMACPPMCRAASGVSGVGPCIRGEDVARFGDASPDLLYSAAALVDAFPDARLLQIVRDGRDVVAAMLGDEQSMAWFRPSIANVDDELPNPFFGLEDAADRTLWKEATPAGRCALRWRGAVRASARLRADLDNEHLLTVRYEDLVQRPTEVAPEISDFLETRLSAVPLGGDDRETVGLWQGRLGSSQIADIEKIAGQELRRLGYLKTPT